MAPDPKDLGDALGRIAREATQIVSQNGHRKRFGNGGDGALSGMRRVVAGAALAGAAPLAAKGAGKMVRNAVAKRGSSAKDGPAEKAAQGGGETAGEGSPGVGKGRRMPVQQAADIGVPLTTVYNQWTQFEDWPQFMHRFVTVTQEDDCHVSFKAKLWGFSREFVAEIEEQRPDERIQWNVTEGVTHTGVVSFHELAPRLTRVQVSLDVEPGSLLEKAGRGMRHVKRAVRGDLARFKAFIEMREEETGAWRGTIREGKVVKERASSERSSKRASRSGSARARSRSGQGGRSRSSSSGRSGKGRSGSSSGRRRSSSS
jgi:uncharacterized membrane protein